MARFDIRVAQTEDSFQQLTPNRDTPLLHKIDTGTAFRTVFCDTVVVSRNVIRHAGEVTVNIRAVLREAHFANYYASNLQESSMKMLFLFAGLLVHGIAIAQPAGQQQAGLSYTYAELRFVDVDTSGGDGLRLNGSYELENNWLIVGGLTALDFNNNVDVTTVELGGGYVWHYSSDFDLVSTLRYVQADIDTPGGSSDDSGFAFSGGARGLLTPQFEVRGSVNYINLDNSDTYLEIAGDYYFTEQFAAGVSLEFAGDSDVFTIGARWLFK